MLQFGVFTFGDHLIVWVQSLPSHSAAIVEIMQAEYQVAIIDAQRGNASNCARTDDVVESDFALRWVILTRSDLFIDDIRNRVLLPALTWHDLS